MDAVCCKPRVRMSACSRGADCMPCSCRMSIGRVLQLRGPRAFRGAASSTWSDLSADEAVCKRAPAEALASSAFTLLPYSRLLADLCRCEEPPLAKDLKAHGLPLVRTRLGWFCRRNKAPVAVSNVTLLSFCIAGHVKSDAQGVRSHVAVCCSLLDELVLQVGPLNQETTIGATAGCGRCGESTPASVAQANVTVV